METFMWLLSWAASIIGYFVLFMLWAAVMWIAGIFVYEYSNVSKELRKYPHWNKGLTNKEQRNVKLHIVFTGAPIVSLDIENGESLKLHIKRHK